MVTLATMWGMNVPLAHTLSDVTSLGQFGAPGAAVAGTTVRLAIFAWYFTTGRRLKTGIL